MEQKTKIVAENGKQELMITREFDLPVELLFKAYAEAELLSEWMGTKVLKLESKPHGGYELETSDAQGNVLFRANGVIHEFVPNQKITRTFEMENTGLPVQLEYLEFEKITENASRLKMQVVYKSLEVREQILKMPFAYGINMAHDRLQDIVNKLK
ncbi:SRPBCC domain-containing protein [Candidatus Peregrinibacteria bacterium]|nr:SRPBCC domain-containing protein [Candidatus Peregrinibacteria bacterium]